MAFVELRKKSMVHKNLALENIFVNNGMISLTGFSSAGHPKHINNNRFPNNSKIQYWAPEVLKKQTIDSKADLWSMGVVYYQLLFGKFPFDSQSLLYDTGLDTKKEKMIRIIENHAGKLKTHDPDNEISTESINLLYCLLNKSTKYRTSWEEFLKHSVFSDSHKKYLQEKSVDSTRSVTVSTIEDCHKAFVSSVNNYLYEKESVYCKNPANKCNMYVSLLVKEKFASLLLEIAETETKFENSRLGLTRSSNFDVYSVFRKITNEEQGGIVLKDLI